MTQNKDVASKGDEQIRSPPNLKTVQIEREGSPCAEVPPQQKSTIYPAKENEMNQFILPVVAIITAASLALGLGAMLTKTSLALQVGKYLDLRISPSAATTEE